MRNVGGEIGDLVGLPVSLPVLETTPSIWYHELYKTVNILLDQSTYRRANFLTREGHPSVMVPRDGYGSAEVLKENPVAFFSHRQCGVPCRAGNIRGEQHPAHPAIRAAGEVRIRVHRRSQPPDPLVDHAALHP